MFRIFGTVIDWLLIAVLFMAFFPYSLVAALLFWMFKS